MLWNTVDELAMPAFLSCVGPPHLTHWLLLLHVSQTNICGGGGGECTLYIWQVSHIASSCLHSFFASSLLEVSNHQPTYQKIFNITVTHFSCSSRSKVSCPPPPPPGYSIHFLLFLVGGDSCWCIHSP